MLRELWSATRRLSHEPVFTLASAGTLALGISSATALFSALHAVLLEPLPLPRPSELYTVRTAITDGRFTRGDSRQYALARCPLRP